jgi:hypothetical protein
MSGGLNDPRSLALSMLSRKPVTDLSPENESRSNVTRMLTVSLQELAGT